MYKLTHNIVRIENYFQQSSLEKGDIFSHFVGTSNQQLKEAEQRMNSASPGSVPNLC